MIMLQKMKRWTLQPRSTKCRHALRPRHRLLQREIPNPTYAHAHLHMGGLEHFESLMEAPRCKIWDVTLDRGYNATQYATKVFSAYCCFMASVWWPSVLLWTHFSESSVMERDTVISSMQDLQDLSLFDNGIDSFFQVSLFSCIILVVF